MGNFFPRWTNFFPLKLIVAVIVLGTGVTAAITVYWTPKYSRVGYEPEQPIPFDHSLHAGQLGMDCR
ncbi:MAG: cytochrome c3 family protein, partial [Verrucomicrobiota bacterium]